MKIYQPADVQGTFAFTFVFNLLPLTAIRIGLADHVTSLRQFPVFSTLSCQLVEKGDKRPIPPGPTSVDSQNGNEQTYKRWCNCLHIINMVHRHWSRLGCSGDIYWWTTFQWLSLFIYLFSWLEIHCWLRLRHAWLASLISTLGQCLLLHHWPCVYFSTIGPMVTSLVRLTLERLSVYYTFFLLPGDAGLLAPVQKNLAFNNGNNNNNICLCHPWRRWRKACFSYDAFPPNETRRESCVARSQWCGGPRRSRSFVH